MLDTSTMAAAIAALSTVIIVVVTVSQFILQRKKHQHEIEVANANYQVALFEKRIETVFSIEQMMGEFFKTGRPSVEAALKLRYQVRHADYLFPEKSLGFIKELIDKAFEHQRAKDRWEPLRERAYNREELTDGEEKEKVEALAEMHRLERWFLEQCREERLKAEFDQYLKLPESL